MTPMVNTGLLSQAPYTSVGSGLQPQPTQTQPPSRMSPLVNTAGNYGYPITTGLLGALGQQLQPGTTDFTAQALQLAGNPHAGPYAPVPIPSGPGIPGAPPGISNSGSSAGSTALGIMGALARNPSLVKNIGSSAANLFGAGGGPATSAGAANAAANPSIFEGADPAATQSLLGDTAAGGGAATGGLGALSASDIAASDAAAGGALTSDIAGGAAISPATEAALSGGADAAGGSAAGAAGGLGATAGALTAVGLPLALMAYAMSTPPYTLNSDYYNRLNSSLNTPTGLMEAMDQALVNPGVTDWAALGQHGITPQNVQAMYAQAVKNSAPPKYVGGGRGGSPV
jgi:hypothetical protein